MNKTEIPHAWTNKNVVLVDLTYPDTYPQYIGGVGVESVESKFGSKSVVTLSSFMPNEWLLNFDAKKLGVYAGCGLPDVIDEKILRFIFSDCVKTGQTIENIICDGSLEWDATMIRVFIEADVEVIL